MKTNMQKYEIILLKKKNWSNSRISREFNVSRNTIKKYWNEYNEKLNELLELNPNLDTREIVEELISNPTYDTSKRVARKYTKEIDALLNEILKNEEEKTLRLGNHHKQALTNIQIHQLIIEKGHDIGVTTLSNKIKEKRNINKEVFIKQDYDYGERFEYDFGEVKLIINGKQTKGYLAVLTSPASKFRWAYLYHNSKMDVFIDSHVRFFELVGGSFKEGVYDNMRNVVSKFIGRHEKKLNERLIQLALYYDYEINVTNCFSGNEKGTVEGAVKWIRNKVYALEYQFPTFEVAADYLQEKLVRLNKVSTIEAEKPFLKPCRFPFEAATISLHHVNKYSFIRLDNNDYSVPEALCDKEVVVKAYPNDIYVFYKGKQATHHSRMVGKGKTCIDINHYLNTFLKKPGALKNSTALKSVPELKDIFDSYYKEKPKEFIEILRNNKESNMDELIKKLDPIHQKEDYCKANRIINETEKQVAIINSLFIGGSHYVN